VTSHVLRHTFGTELTRRGVNIVTVAEVMGHASLETTRLYTWPSAADMQRAVDLLTPDEHAAAAEARAGRHPLPRPRGRTLRPGYGGRSAPA
jgi:integrase